MELFFRTKYPLFISVLVEFTQMINFFHMKELAGIFFRFLHPGIDLDKLFFRTLSCQISVYYFFTQITHFLFLHISNTIQNAKTLIIIAIKIRKESPKEDRVGHASILKPYTYVLPLCGVKLREYRLFPCFSYHADS